MYLKVGMCITIQFMYAVENLHRVILRVLIYVIILKNIQTRRRHSKFTVVALMKAERKVGKQRRN